VVEGRRGVSSAGGTRPPRPTRDQVARRRLFALGGFGVALLAVVVIAVTAFGGGGSAPATTQSPFIPKPLRIVFPEGFTRLQMADRIVAVNQIALRERKVKPALSRKRYLAVTASSTLPATFAQDHKRRDLEGFLFPATYEFTARTPTGKLIRDQLDAFQQNWKKLDLSYARKKKLTQYDILIIASMVEKETLAPDERALVAAVIYNRLHARMPLQIDATLRYGLHIPPTESIRESQLASDSPYNTRKFPGLPPTPIANPGLASIQAAAHPAKVNYLYFVRKPDKVHHFFTASFREFQDYASQHGYSP
jgi:UPF0755 protein